MGKDPYNFIKERNDPESLTVLGLEPRQSWEPTSQRWLSIFSEDLCVLALALLPCDCRQVTSYLWASMPLCVQCVAGVV